VVEKIATGHYIAYTMTAKQEEPQEIQEDTPPQKNAESVAAGLLGKKIEELKEELSKAKDTALRAAAEAENVRRRAAKEVEDANKYGVSTFAKDLLSVAENLTRAMETLPEDQRSGVELTLKELLNIFERRGIKRIDPKPGEKFDHNFHQAMVQLEDPKFEPGSIIQVLQAGYLMHDRLLRPALVSVCKAQPQKEHKLDATA
jgi:molecular chaperone GrpE